MGLPAEEGWEESLTGQRLSSQGCPTTYYWHMRRGGARVVPVVGAAGHSCGPGGTGCSRFSSSSKGTCVLRSASIAAAGRLVPM